MDPITFWTAIAILYLAECVSMLEPGSLLFTRTFGPQARQRRPWLYPGNGHWAWRVLPPLQTGHTHFYHPGAFAGALMDRKSVVARLDQFNKSTRATRTLARVLLFVLFLLGPVAASLIGLERAFIPLAAVVMSLSGSIAWQYVRASRALYPEAQGRIGTACKLLLYPISALRSCDLLSRELFRGHDAVVVASVLCDTGTVRRLGRERLLEALHPGTDGLEPPEAAALIEAGRIYARRLTAYLESAGIRIPESELAPPRTDPGSRSYCPRCGNQFTLARGACRECGGVALLEFPAARGASS